VSKLAPNQGRKSSAFHPTLITPLSTAPHIVTPFSD